MAISESLFGSLANAAAKMSGAGASGNVPPGGPEHYIKVSPNHSVTVHGSQLKKRKSGKSSFEEDLNALQRLGLYEKNNGNSSSFSEFSGSKSGVMKNHYDRHHDIYMGLQDRGIIQTSHGPVGMERISPVAAFGNLLSKITHGAGMALSKAAEALGGFFSTKVTVESNERKHYSSLAMANKMDKRRHRSAAFNALSRKHDNAVAYRRSERAKKKAHRREKDRIAFQRGYW